MAPERDLVDKELDRIDDFVLAGKRIAVVASAVNVRARDSLMHATLSAHGLEKLLAGYGIEMRRDVVEDFGRPFKVEVMTTTSSTPLAMRFPPIHHVKDDERFTGDEQLLDTGFASFFRIPEVPFPFASSLVLHPERQPDLKPGALRVLARSTPSARPPPTSRSDLCVNGERRTGPSRSMRWRPLPRASCGARSRRSGRRRAAIRACSSSLLRSSSRTRSHGPLLRATA